MKVLVTGSDGQLAREIKELVGLHKSSNYFVFRNRADLDICNYDSVFEYIVENDIDIVINCAAYNNVDLAEDNIHIARSVNSNAILNLVNALKEVNGKLIHISTDYVFDGTNSKPYIETDTVNPLSAYGKTKSEGENIIFNSTVDAIVIRTSWLFSAYGDNFLKKILKIANKNDKISVISDKVGSPTYAEDLAKTCLKMLNNSKFNEIIKNEKLYHFSNEGAASWYEFASAIIDYGKINCKIIPESSGNHYSKAERPSYSVLNSNKIKKDFNIDIPHWRDSLYKCILKLNYSQND